MYTYTVLPLYPHVRSVNMYMRADMPFMPTGGATGRTLVGKRYLGICHSLCLSHWALTLCLSGSLLILGSPEMSMHLMSDM